jgi:ATP-binding cassette subfamily B protein
MRRNEKLRLLIRFYKFTLKYIKEHLLAATFLIINTFLSVIIPYVVMQIIDNAIANKNIQLLITLCITYIVCYLVSNISQVLSSYIYVKIARKVAFGLRLQILEHISKLSGKFYSNSADIITRVINDVNNVEQVATNMVFNIISDCMVGIAMFFMLFNLQPKLIIITLSFQPLIILTQLKFSKKISNAAFEVRQDFKSLSINIHQYLSNIMEVIFLNAKEYLLNKYSDSEKKFIKSRIKLQLNSSLSSATVSMINGILSISILGIGGYYVIKGTMTIGALVIFNTYLQKLIGPIYRLANSNIEIQGAIVSIDRLFEILDIPQIKENSKQCNDTSIKGQIKFEDVEFSYVENKKALNKVSVLIKKGATMGIVGKSGSGKTTLTKLLFRLWDVDSGSIYIDEKNINDYSIKNLRDNISIISQDIVLFDDTILNNLIIANKEILLEMVIDIVKKADIYDFIQSLPEGFDTIVGEKGIRLSGGQKQRIAIARALLRDTPIIIFDEATSSLDTISEYNIQKRLTTIFTNKTTIIIAHRLSTLDICDYIYVLDKGKVLEEGNHKDLMDSKKIYYEMYMKSVNA